jgi:hypothetical protein
MQPNTYNRASRRDGNRHPSLNRSCASLVAVLALLLSSTRPATAQTTVETFEGGTNNAGWAFNPGADIIEPTGGNPGAWLHNPLLDTFAPILTSSFGVPSDFNGNLRAKGVISMGVDGRTDHADFGAGGRNFSILLRNTRGTPGDFDDDDYAYFVGPLVPQVGEGWRSYNFAIPSQDTSAVPAGWSGGHAGDPENFRPGVTWNDVITNVDRVEFWWLHPAHFAIFQQWNVGVDNVSVTVPEPASATCALAAVSLGVLSRRRACRRRSGN